MATRALFCTLFVLCACAAARGGGWHFPVRRGFFSRARRGGPRNRFANFVAVADRAGGTVSLVDPRTLRATRYRLRGAGEPMYFVCMFRSFGRRPLELWVGDRTRSRLVILELRGRRMVPAGALPTPRGLFHSMLTQRFDAARPLSFSTCDRANVTVVHDVRARALLCTIVRPPLVAALGGRPHDVSSDDAHAYVTYVGAADGHGYVASYDARTCRLVACVRTAKDPHVAVRFGSRVFVAAQGGQVLSLSAPRLRVLSCEAMSSPHGIAISFNSKFVYVTNIAGGGTNAVEVFSAATGRRLPCPQINATHPTPHNPAPAFDNSELYITHTVAGQKFNSAWDIDMRTGCPDPSSERVFMSGDTPFGIALISSPEIYQFLINQ